MTSFSLASGRHFDLTDAGRKLDLRAGLPGAFLFDQAAHALRRARAAGLPLDARLDLALASSWLVNSPAPSPSLRLLATPPRRELFLTLIAAIEALPEEAGPGHDPAELAHAVSVLSEALGEKRALGAEAISKILALLLPESVPLLPAPACAYLLAAPPVEPGERFAAGLLAFRAATHALYTDLVGVARAHEAAVLDAAQVLDRVLWFDSEGHRHFPPLAAAPA